MKKRLVSITRAHRAVTLSVAAVLLVALVGFGVWRQIGVRAATGTTTLIVVSDTTNTYQDGTASGPAVLTYGNFGCTGIDTSGFCTGGAWLSAPIPGAHWIWETRIPQPGQNDHGIVFSKTFAIPAGATGITGQLQIAADNSYDVQVNGTEVGTDSIIRVGTYDIGADLHSGQNTITATVVNVGGYDATNNPGGLLYSADISFVADSTPPTTTAKVNGPTGSNGWHRGPVSVSLSATDPDDAASALTTSYSQDNGATWQTYSSPLTFNQDGQHSLQFYSVDPAGNIEATQTQDINIDSTPPSLNISGAASGTYDLCSGTLPARPTFAPADSLSGLDGTQGDSWTTPTAGSGVGSYVYSAHAADKAGNTASDTRTYTVQYGSAFGGILRPLNDDGDTDVYHVGRPLWVRFQLTCNGVPITTATATLTVAPAGGVAASPGMAAGASTTNTFTYDSNRQQYILFLWTRQDYTNPDGSVVSFTPGMWNLTITLDDGSTHTTTIQLLASQLGFGLNPPY